MGKLYTFTYFDGTIETVRDGNLGLEWVKEWAKDNIYGPDLYQVSALNYIRSGSEFLNT